MYEVPVTAQDSILDTEPFHGSYCSTLHFQARGIPLMARSGSRGGYSKGSSTSNGVRAARLHQKSGSSNSFGGYTKVNKGNGAFTMKKT